MPLIPGKLCRVDWPEYQIECPGCQEVALVTPCGMAHTAREAERAIRKQESEEANDWKKRDGLWYCPNC